MLFLLSLFLSGCGVVDNFTCGFKKEDVKILNEKSLTFFVGTNKEDVDWGAYFTISHSCQKINKGNVFYNGIDEIDYETVGDYSITVSYQQKNNKVITEEFTVSVIRLRATWSGFGRPNLNGKGIK